MLTSRSIGTHNHLAPKHKKHSISHPESTVSDAPKKDPPFGKLQFGSDKEPLQSAYKPIFKI